MTARGEYSRPLALLIALAYVALIWLAVAGFTRQLLLQRQGRSRATVALWRR